MGYPLKKGLPPFAKPPECQTCSLWGNGRGFGFPTIGDGQFLILFVGESLGKEEVKTGEFFVGPAGGQFNHVLKRGGWERGQFGGIENVIKCQPPGNKLAGQSYQHEATKSCAHFLDSTIETMQPKAIVALGGTALNRLTDQSGIMRNRGFIHDSRYGIPVVGTFHPSYLLPRRKSKGSAKYTWVVVMDIRKAIRVANGNRELIPQHYLLDPSLDLAEQFMGEYNQTGSDTIMAWDLETLYKMKMKNEQKLKMEGQQPVTRISFAFKPGYAMSIPWEPKYIERIIKPIFRMNRTKVGHNSKGFDEPIIIFQEQMELNGLLLDSMDMFHVFQPNIERNLEFVASLMTDHLTPWKHLSQSDPVFYSCVDSDATITSTYRLQVVMRGMRI